MDYSTFDQILKENTPPSGLPLLLQALWHDKKGDWEAAHNIAQEIETSDGSWVHAYLHRVEGDEWNAGYWYRRAGRSFPQQSLEEEWDDMVRYFLKK